MILFAAQKYRFVLRAAVFFGVLGGLLFSCGEGIRLFPFPVAAAKQKLTSVRVTGTENAYQKNFYRFENQPASFKDQNGNRHLGANNLTAMNFATRVTAAANSFASASPHGFEIFSERLLSAVAGSRAPPFS